MIPVTAERTPRCLAWLERADPVLLLLRGSLVVLLINSNDDTVLLLTVATVCVVALPNPPVLCSPWLWTALFVGVGLRQLWVWESLDDHVAATTYWVGAVALGLRAKDVRGTLSASARFLVGTIFACAVAWKVGAGEYLDGTFWRHTLLFDERFEWVARVVGDTSPAMIDANHESYARLSRVAAERGASPGATLVHGARLAPLAAAFTWWGVVVEAAVAAAFLSPLPARWAWTRHATLAAFALSTYLVVPVAGFIALLALLASAQVTTGRQRGAYHAAAIALLAWAGVWPVVFL